jgi:hypothetical protein
VNPNEVLFLTESEARTILEAFEAAYSDGGTMPYKAEELMLQITDKWEDIISMDSKLWKINREVKGHSYRDFRYQG